MKFKVDDKVIWESQAGSYARTKIGVVTQVIPAGERPMIKDIGMQRDHESYLVHAHKEGETSKRWYWPRVSQLHRVV